VKGRLFRAGLKGKARRMRRGEGRRGNETIYSSDNTRKIEKYTGFSDDY
jgi:hypothetical protein